MNFNAGPAALPLAALERAQAELLDLGGTGMSVMEHSHRGKAYEAVHNEAIALTRELLAVPESHLILLLQGGASQQFATVPMNLLPSGKSADYVLTGAWSQKAYKEGKSVGTVRVAGTTEKDGKFGRIPAQSELSLDANAAYAHITTNNTIIGTQWHEFPDTGKVPLVADMSSDILWKPIDVSKFGLIDAGAQKNIGPSGLVVVIVRKDCGRGWQEGHPDHLPVPHPRGEQLALQHAAHVLRLPAPQRARRREEERRPRGPMEEEEPRQGEASLPDVMDGALGPCTAHPWKKLHARR